VQGRDKTAFERAHVSDHVVDRHHRIPDELPGAVVGDLAAAVGRDDVDPLHPVPVLAHWQLPRRRAAASRVHGPVLEQQHHVGDRSGLAGGLNTLLQGRRLPVLNRAQ
jgi:hypothetical protein